MDALFADIARSLNEYFAVPDSRVVGEPLSHFEMSVPQFLESLKPRPETPLPFTFNRLQELSEVYKSPGMQRQYPQTHVDAYLLALKQLLSVSSSESVFAAFELHNEVAPGIQLEDVVFD